MLRATHWKHNPRLQVASFDNPVPQTPLGLKKGDAVAILLLQQALNQVFERFPDHFGKFRVKEDGVYDWETAAAVKKYQRHTYLHANGKLDYQTLQSLDLDLVLHVEPWQRPILPFPGPSGGDGPGPLRRAS